MKIVTIQDGRRFSLEEVQTTELAAQDGLRVSLVCFEAGQQGASRAFPGPVAYQVIEGEAVVKRGEQRERLGKGKLLLVAAGDEHRVENAGGGLLVVLATRVDATGATKLEG